MADISLNNPLPMAPGEVQQPAEPEDGGWFLPYIPPPPKPKPEPPPKPKELILWRLTEEVLRKDRVQIPPEPTCETGVLDQAAPADEEPAEPEPPQPPPRMATAAELVTWIRICLLAQTHLSADEAELVAFWVISTWFWEDLKVLPCLVITGLAPHAREVLHILDSLCPRSALLAGFRRSHLKTVWSCRTLLIWEPNLDKRTAALLGTLTDREFRVVEGGYMDHHPKSIAIYLGEDPETHKIQNSIHLHLAPTGAEPSPAPRRPDEMIKYLPVHLEQYRVKNSYQVRGWTWTPRGLTPETAILAKKLGECIVGAPEVRQRLVALLKTEDKQRRSELANTTDVMILEATRTLCREERQNAYAREIAAAANLRLESCGETARLRPEHVGHVLRRFGLRTHRLSQTGNGLTFNKSITARIDELAAMYMMEDASAKTENLHGSQMTESTTTN